jgi:pyridoxal phosphate enzyme (YggS family)
MGADWRALPSDDPRQIIGANVAAIRARIAEACRLAGRDPTEITLVAVTKYVSAEVTAMLLDVGVRELAESRPQALWEKASVMASHQNPPRWNLIGHLQRNKIRRTLPLLGMLQSLDSLRLLEAIDTDAVKAADATKAAHALEAAEGLTPSSLSPRLDALVEVNLTDDPGRSGAAVEDVPALVAAAARSPAVRLRGLMGMAARPDTGSDARRDFARLRVLRDHVAEAIPDPQALADLSMGMSGDFEAAILEGSTIVRIGSALFEGLA